MLESGYSICSGIASASSCSGAGSTASNRQRFEAAAVSLQLTSLYFACVANGNSQMYDSTVFISLVERAGFEICEVTDHVGEFHTLLECRPVS